MQLEIYSIFDIAAGVYSRPFFLVNDAVAVRLFSDLMADENTDISKHPEQFIMYKCGSFDDIDGTMDLLTPGTVVVCKALDLVKRNLDTHVEVA